MESHDDITIWFNASCSKSRVAADLLAELGIEATVLPYLDVAPARQQLEELLVKLGTDDPLTITRTGDRLYIELGLEGADRDTLLSALAAHPSLIQRPIVVRGGRAVVARPPERLRELLDDADA